VCFVFPMRQEVETTAVGFNSEPGVEGWLLSAIAMLATSGLWSEVVW
jgi:hypothetical protein